MSEIDLAGAQAALTEAMGFNEPAAAPVEQATAPTATPVEPAATPAEADSFTSIDPTSLPPQLQQVYKSMQADYTRKNQAVADLRKQFDELGGFEQAQQAVQFAQALNSDPDFALRVHAQLSDSLQRAGLTSAQAQAEATRQVEQAATEQPQWDEDDPLTPLQKELHELKDWKQTMEAERRETFLSNELNRQEMSLRQANPHYTDTDFADIYNLSYRTDGNLIAAEQMFRGMRDRVIESYMQQKQAAPQGVPRASIETAAQQPHSFDTLDDAHKAAMDAVRAAGYS